MPDTTSHKEYMQELDAEIYRANNNKGRQPIEQIQDISDKCGVPADELEKEVLKLKQQSGLSYNFAIGMTYAKYMTNYAKSEEDRGV